MGVVGSGVAQGHVVDRRARVQWAMGSSVLFSVLLLVSVGGILSTLGDELVGVCINCTLGACSVEGGRGVVGFLVLYRLVHRAVQLKPCYVGGMWARFWSSYQKSYGGH